MQTAEDGETTVYLNVDHHQRQYQFEAEAQEGAESKAPKLSKEEIAELAQVGDVRAPFAANVCEVSVEAGQKVEAGDRLIVLEAMKMQTPIVTEISGTVDKISAKVGDAMQPGDKLVKVVAD